MKYFIHTDALHEVSEDAYDIWYEEEGEQYKLPDYSRRIGEYIHTIETLFVGVFEDFEEPLPFILVYFRDRMIYGRKNRWKNEIDEVEQFGTLKEMRCRYESIVNEIEAKQLNIL